MPRTDNSAAPSGGGLNASALPRRELLFLLLSVLLFCSPMFFTPGGFTSRESYRAHDWFIAATHDALFRDAVLSHHQFPLRSHLVGGGYPILAHPSDASVSPLILTSLLFGEQVGLKLNLIIALLLGALGIYLLARNILHMGGLGPLFAAVAFAVAGWHPSRILVGYYESTFYLFFPLILYLILRARKSFSLFVLGVIASAVCFMQALGGVAAFGIYAMAYVLYGVRDAPGEGPRRKRHLVSLLLVMVMAGSLGAVKFIPTLDLLGRGSMDRMPPLLLEELPEKPVDQFLFQRSYYYYLNYRPEILQEHQDFFYTTPAGFFQSLLSPVSLKNQYISRPAEDIESLKPEYPYISVGPLVVGLALLAILLFARAMRRSIYILVFFTLVCFGTNGPLDLFRLLSYLPLINSMHRPIQYFNFFILTELVLLAGYAFWWLEQRLEHRLPRAIFVCVALLALVPSALENASRYYQAFRFPMPEVSKVKAFHQVALKNALLREQIAEGYGNTYLNVLRGIGTIVWDSNIKLPESADPRYLVDRRGIISLNDEYHGEAFFKRPQNKVTTIHISPNVIEIGVSVTQTDILFINQNADPYWRAEVGELLLPRGKLRVRCSPGKRVIRLTYRYWPFYAGLIWTLLTVAALWLIGRRYGGRWWPRAKESASDE